PLGRTDDEGAPVGLEDPQLAARRRGQVAGMERGGRAGRAREGPGQLALARYGFQTSGTRPTATTIHASSRGWRGERSRRMPASSGVRSRLRRLHGRHAAATFSHTCSPPRLRGSTWSIESACAPQYWHWWLSRAKTARRDIVVRRWYGTFTMYRSRITSGACSTRWAERTRPSS